QVELLGAPDRGGGQVLVQARLEHHVVRLQVVLGFPQRQVQAAQGRTPVARYVAGGIEAGQAVARPLQQRQFDQRLGAAQVDAAGVQGVFVVQGGGGQAGRAGGEGGVHACLLVAG